MVILAGLLLLRGGEVVASGQTNVIRPEFSLGTTLRGERTVPNVRSRVVGTDASGTYTRLEVELRHVSARPDREAAEVVYLKRPAGHPGVLGVLTKPSPRRLLDLMDLTSPLTESELKPRSWRAITGERALPHGFQDPKTMEPEGLLLGGGGE